MPHICVLYILMMCQYSGSLYLGFVFVFLMYCYDCVICTNFMTIFSHKVGPIGNRHIKDHILCNFHAIHPYLIHVANFVNVVIIDGSSYSYD